MQISQEEKEAVYKTIYARRDTRSEFINEPIEDEVLYRILDAAHHAPSVGFMQPWDFVVIKDNGIKKQIKADFEKANEESKQMFEGERKELYSKLKLEGILEAPIGICVTCSRKRTGDVVLGKTVQYDMDLYSTVCAIQNLWLAARAENLGVGWVSIIHEAHIKEVLNLPDDVLPIAYLCVGKVSSYHDKPELEEMGWQNRVPLDELIHFDTWNNKK